MKKYKAIMITIPKSYDFSEKYRAITTPGMFAYHYTKKRPTKDYEKVLVLHNGLVYMCDRFDTDLGIGFHNWQQTSKVDTKGFQGFRYLDIWKEINKNNMSWYRWGKRGDE